MKLRDYQEICKAKIEANWRKGSHKQLAVMPTGAGKTVLFAALASEFTRKNQGVLVVAHREELIIQAAEKLAAATGIIPGIIKAGYKPNVDAPIQVGSIQTLARRQKYPEANLIIIDEAHHAASNSYRQLIAQYPDAQILGVTATPQRIDGYGFEDLFEKLVVGATTGQLIAEGHLCKFKMIGGFAKLGLFTPKGRDFTIKELERAATKIKPEDVVKCWQDYCFGKKTVVFAVNVSHSQAIAEQFQKNGIAAEHLDGETPTGERKAILERFRTGSTQIISNCGILTEGFDCPDIDVVQCARPTTSISLWLQMLGRALRPAPGKEYAILVDQTDNWYRLGTPDQHRHWSLKPESVDKNSPGVRNCGYCHHVFKPMEARITSKVVWNPRSETFETLLTTPCPNCSKPVTWQLISSSDITPNQEKKEEFDLEVEYREIPSECRFEILEQIVKIRKLGSRFKNLPNREKKFIHSLTELIHQQSDIQLAEIRVALDILEIGFSPTEILAHALLVPLCQLAAYNNWYQIERLMKGRTGDIKKLIWDMLPKHYQKKIHQLKKDLAEKPTPSAILSQVTFKVGDLVAAAAPNDLKYLWHGVVEDVSDDGSEVFVFWQSSQGTATSSYEIHEASYLRRLFI
ncbi:DEAD/DEAH box helicase [Nostoc sp. C110]|uniref:DEAD/DEAH box helicase n=1 Tax=Nostoc sp. C110 TaxID=3349876 RepID=UPI00370D478E